MDNSNPPPRTPVLPQQVRSVSRLLPEAQPRQVLHRSHAPAQMSLFPRPIANDRA